MNHHQKLIAKFNKTILHVHKEHGFISLCKLSGKCISNKSCQCKKVFTMKIIKYEKSKNKFCRDNNGSFSNEL